MPEMTSSPYIHEYDNFEYAYHAGSKLWLHDIGHIQLDEEQIAELKKLAYKPHTNLDEYEPTKIGLFHSTQHHGHEEWLAMEARATDEWIENTHTFVQWWFPLMEKSQSISSAPVLTLADVDYKRNDLDQIRQIQWMASRMMRFYESSDHWVCHYNHNHLRITRIIKSLRLLAGNEPADDWKQWLFHTVKNEKDALHRINSTTVDLWLSA